MVNLITKFVSCCRASDLRVSTSEVLDCMNQLQLVNVFDELQFRTVLNANFVKSQRDQSHFDHLYHLFFHELQTEIAGDQHHVLSKYSEEILAILRNMADGDHISEMVIDFLSGDPVEFLREMLRIQTFEEEKHEVKKMRNNVGAVACRLEVSVKINKTRNKIVQFLGDNHSRMGEKTSQDIGDYFNARLESAYSMLTKDPRPQNVGLKEVKSYKKNLNHLGELPFSQLTKTEVEEVRVAIDQLVRKLKDIVSRRYASKNRGALDIKKTLRRAARYQGVPVEIKYRNRPLRKAKIVTLCDISSSVWGAARFMLNILYSLQECFTQVKSFVFISEVADVSDIFEKHEINDAIEKILTDVDIEYSDFTDYGATFSHFKKEYMDVINKKTTLIIIGDGRSNYMNPQEKILEEMREKCRRMIWLIPEPESVWGTGDSEIYTYRGYCHELRPCLNLNQLIDFVEELVL